MRTKKGNGINILSLFGGMDTGRVALNELGIKVNKSYYSEIKPYVIFTL